MTVVLQITGVPAEVRDVLSDEARRRGQSVQAYLLDLVEREARTLSNRHHVERTRHLRTELDIDPVDIVREGRDGGFDIDRQWSDVRSSSSGPASARGTHAGGA